MHAQQNNLTQKLFENSRTVKANRRSHERIPTRDLCELIVDTKRNPVGCMVHNISKGGALIEVSTLEVPDRFVLVNYSRRTRVICSVAWRCEYLIGVEFASVPRVVEA